MIAIALYCVLANPTASLAASAQENSSIVPSQAASSVGIDTSTISSEKVSSEKVSQFVSACLQVVSLIERREGQLQAAETDSESLRIQREIETDAIALIEQAGLTRQEYLQLLSLANVDPEFGERVATLLQEASSS
ncbi:DUF4168 domain-containing protein [Myxacorys almedinensis A]|uniref:DUF4168 domain-containing protein n=2 Tax=Myxacorys TaxID=2056239 RepID=A0A8J7YXQ1_9CYAN|nr:DUF4168 domain-containing protein [Myxacorys almedinensis A]